VSIYFANGCNGTFAISHEGTGYVIYMQYKDEKCIIRSDWCMCTGLGSAGVVTSRSALHPLDNPDELPSEINLEIPEEDRC
jgi:hypothetical protein